MTNLIWELKGRESEREGGGGGGLIQEGCLFDIMA